MTARLRIRWTTTTSLAALSGVLFVGTVWSCLTETRPGEVAAAGNRIWEAELGEDGRQVVELPIEEWSAARGAYRLYVHGEWDVEKPLPVEREVRVVVEPPGASAVVRQLPEGNALYYEPGYAWRGLCSIECRGATRVSVEVRWLTEGTRLALFGARDGDLWIEDALKDGVDLVLMGVTGVLFLGLLVLALRSWRVGPGV